MHTTTQHLLSALWDDALDAPTVLEQLTDRHYASGPEPDVERERLLSDCRQYVRIRAWINVVHAGALGWAAIALLNWFGTDQYERTGSGLFASLLVPYSISALVVFVWELYANRRRLELSNGRENSEQLPPGVGQSVVVYSDFSPFSAFGISLESWSLLIDTFKTLPSHREPEAFTASDLQASISEKLQGLLLGARTQDVLFVRGWAAPDVPGLLQSKTAKPATAIDHEVLTAYIDRAEPNARLYRTYMQRVGSAGTVFSAFIRVYKRQSQLFVECHQYLLPDLREDLRSLDNEVPHRPARFILQTLFQSVVTAPFVAMAAAFETIASVIRLGSEILEDVFTHPLDKQKLRDGRFDYGHRKTIRSSYSADTYDTFFQTQDKEALRKATNIAVIGQLAAFLKSKGIDVGDLESSKQQIINSGVFVAGGTFNGASLAAGEKAQANTSVAANAAKI
jgi:hypothetical protein